MQTNPAGAATDPRLARARSGLLAVGVVAASGVALSVLYAMTGLGVPCPVKLVTGWDCPFCGATRLGAALLHGDVAAAFAYNPLVFVALPIVAGAAVVWSIEVFRGRPLPRPRALAAGLGWLAARWLPIGIGVALAYTLIRNLA